jgi:carboxyl-terminal processing protease
LPGIKLGEDFGNLGVLGERTDPLLDRTINYILTGAKGNFYSRKKEYTTEFSNSKLTTPTGNNMYLEFK